MEFTYEGIVRAGFGFQNPNHAAALINLLLPLLWAWGMTTRFKAVKAGSVAASAVLVVMLCMTLSRTGTLVLFIELAVFLLLARPSLRRHWRGFAVAAAFIFAVLVFFGSAGRTAAGIAAPDRAVTNRFHIWEGGLALFGQNPCGVGFGRSGEIYSAALAPPERNIVCRTMVSSWLTLAVEFGMIPAVLVLSLLIYALAVRLWPPAAPWNAGLSAALIAGGISGMASSCFDWGILFSGRHMPGLTAVNLAAQWLLFGVFCGIVAACVCRPPKYRLLPLAAAGAGILLVLAVYAAGVLLPAPHCRVTGDSLLELGSGETSLAAVTDGETSLRDAVRFLRLHFPEDRALITLAPRERQGAALAVAERILLFGSAAAEEKQYYNMDAVTLILVSPPRRFEIPETVSAVYLKRYREERHRVPEGVETVWY